MNFDSAEIQNLLEEYRHLNFDTIFKFDSVFESYYDYAKFTTSNKVNLGFPSIDNEMRGIRPGEVCYIISPTNVGKCHGKGQGILMDNGEIKPVENIMPGDYLAGIGNKKRRVLSTSRGRGRLFRINQKWGNPYIVNENHILSLRKAYVNDGAGKIHGGDILNIPLMEYMGKTKNFKKFFKGWKDKRKFSELPITIDPYILGLWLGDGKSTSSAFYSADEEIISSLRDYAKRVGQDFRQIKEKSNCYKLTITNCDFRKDKYNLQRELRLLGLLGNKHIPQNYKTNTEDNRLKLLAGLIDTDGWKNIHKSAGGDISSYCITLTNEKLVKDIMFVAGSLGFRTNIRQKISKIKSINYQTIAYNVYISGDVERIPVKIARKKIQKKQRQRIFNYSNITGIDYLGVGDYYGFTLDGDGLYLLDDFTVTHNTACSMNILKHNLRGDTIIPFFSLENNEYQIFERMIQLEMKCSSFDIENRFIGKDEMFTAECRAIADKWSNVINIVKRVTLDDVIPYIKVCEKLTGKRTKFVLIDYAQLIKHTGKEYEKLSEIAQRLKEISLNLRLPLIVLSQVSRNEARSENGLNLYSAKGSGEIENSAQILFALEKINEVEPGEIDSGTLQAHKDRHCSILKLKTLKKKRGKELTEVKVVLEYPSLRMYEYGKPVQSEVPFEEKPF